MKGLRRRDTDCALEEPRNLSSVGGVLGLLLDSDGLLLE